MQPKQIVLLLRRHIKTILSYFFFIILLSAAFTACQKNVDVADGTFDASDAKEWYYGTFKKSGEWASSVDKGKKLPDWKHGIYSKVGSLEIVEFPLVKAKKAISIQGNSELNNEQKQKLANAALTRIVFIKQGNDIVVREVDYIPDWIYLEQKGFDISAASLHQKSDFSGRIVIKNWSGKIVSIRILNNGKVIKKGKIINAQSNINANAVNRAAESCAMEYCIWQQDCTLTFQGDVVTNECGPWYNTGECWIEDNCYDDPCEGMTEEDCACQMYGACGGGDEEEDEFDEDAEAAIEAEVFSSISDAAETTVSFTSPTETIIPFQWVVIKNSADFWKVTSSDRARGYNSTNTGAVIYDIQHVGSSMSGQTEWARVRRRPGGTPVTLINLSWEETSNSKSIASNYKSGTITVSGKVKNFGIPIKNPTNSCTVIVQ